MAAAIASIFTVTTGGGGGSNITSSTEEWEGLKELKRQLEQEDSDLLIVEGRSMKGIPKSIPLLQRKGVDLFDLGLLHQHMRVRLASSKFFVGTADQIMEEFKSIHIEKGLLYVNYITRKFQSSGYDHEVIDLKSKLIGMTTINWKGFIETIEKEDKVISKLWVGCYDDEGNHPFHRDLGQNGDVRHIVSSGCFGKQFWMKSGVKETGMLLPHGVMVAMNRTASGKFSNIKHSAQGESRGSWVIIFETRDKAVDDNLKK